MSPSPARIRSTIAAAVDQPDDLRELRRFHKVLADVNRLPFRDACFDYVVSRYTLHHTDLDASLPEVRRVLAPGGLLAISVPLAKPVMPPSWTRSPRSRSSATSRSSSR